MYIKFVLVWSVHGTIQLHVTMYTSSFWF